MVFNLQKFLIENGLTKRARLKEDAETKTDAEKLAMGAEEGDDDVLDAGSENDPINDPENLKADTIGTSANVELPKTVRSVKGKQLGGGGGKGLEVNPDAGITPSNKPVRDLQAKQTKLKDLEDKKDALLMQLKSGQLTLDQYKSAIGNIPTQIKKLRADIDKETSVSFDDLDDEVI